MCLETQLWFGFLPSPGPAMAVSSKRPETKIIEKESSAEQNCRS